MICLEENIHVHICASFSITTQLESRSETIAITCSLNCGMGVMSRTVGLQKRCVFSSVRFWPFRPLVDYTIMQYYTESWFYKTCKKTYHLSSWEKMVKQGCWDIPAFIVGCYGVYVVVQCFILTFDVLCGGGSGAIFLLSVHRFLFHYFVKSIVDVLS